MSSDWPQTIQASQTPSVRSHWLLNQNLRKLLKLASTSVVEEVNEFRLINGSRDQEIRSLVVRSRPKSDESLFGFLLRLTELNSYPTPIVILNEAHLDWKFFYYNRILDEHNSNFDRLIHLTTITRNELRELLYTSATKRSDQKP